MDLKITEDTFLKPGPEQADSYKSSDLVPVAMGKVFPVLAYRTEKRHVCFTIDAKKCNLSTLHPSSKNTWWVYDDFAEDPAGYSLNNNPVDNSAPQLKTNFEIKLPGFKGSYKTTTPISIKTPNFTWGEALHATTDGNYRHPENASVVCGIIRVAEVLEQLRKDFNKPIVVSSWYRDPATNKAAGGASQSRHMVGDAVDFHVPGLSLVDIYLTLDDWWGSRGGLARGNGFIHIDCRGYRARWTYPGVK